MEWIQVFTIIGALGAFIMWNTQRIDHDIKALDENIDNEIKALDGKIDVAHRRMDQLYQTLIDIVKKG